MQPIPESKENVSTEESLPDSQKKTFTTKEKSAPVRLAEIKSTEKQSTEIKSTKIQPTGKKPTKPASIYVGPTTRVDGLEIESHFSKVNNPILENELRLKPSEFAVYLYLFRLSWAFKKNYCKVSMTTVSEQCVMSKDATQKALNSLLKRGVVIKDEINHKSGNVYIILLPAECKIVARNPVNRIPVDHIPVNRNSDSSCLNSSQELTEIQSHKRNLKEKDKEITPLTPQGGKPKLEIEQGRLPRDSNVWKEWSEVRERIKSAVSEEEFEPLLGVDFVVQGKSGEIHIKGYYLKTPEDISENLRKVLEDELVEHGINTIKIAV